MMEEVGGEAEVATTKVGELQIADQLQEAALTNVTQAAATRESTPPVSSSPVPKPSDIPAHLLTSPSSVVTSAAGITSLGGMPPPPVGGFVPTPGAISATPPKGYMEKTALLSSDASMSPSAPLTSPSTAYTSPVLTPGAGYGLPTSPHSAPAPPDYTQTPVPMTPPYEASAAVSLEEDGSMGPVYPHPDDAVPTASSFLGWLSSSSIVNKVMAKTKSSVETMITTLDPGMKEVIHSGGYVDLVVTSQKEVKVAPVRQAFQDVFGRARVEGMGSQPNIAPQPVGYSAALKGAEERIENLRMNNHIHVKQPAVSVESFIVELLPNKWYDMACVILVDPVNNIKLEVFGQAIPVPLQYVMQAQDETPADYGLRWSGLAITVGEIIQRNLPHVDHSDWHRHFTGVSRRDMIYTATKTLAGMYRAQILPEQQ